MKYFLHILICCLPLINSNLSSAEEAPITVRDFIGRDVTLKKPATRIIALAPHIVENIFAAGAGELIVGAVDYCDFPEKAKQIPRVGAITSYSYEAILALNPDLVITWHSGYGEKALTALQNYGLNVYASNPKTLEDVSKAIIDFGTLTGKTTIAQKNAKAFLDRLENLKHEYSNKTQQSVLYQVWNEPLQTLNDKHIISDVIRLCGAQNSFGNTLSLAPKISIESVLARNPDIIIASGMGEARPEWLDEWETWPSLEAVKYGNLYFVPPDIIQRHTMRILDGASLMCKHIDKARQKKTKNL